MTLGGCIFAEKRISEYNDMVRRRNRAVERSRMAWEQEREIREMVEREVEEESAAAAARKAGGGGGGGGDGVG